MAILALQERDCQALSGFGLLLVRQLLPAELADRRLRQALADFGKAGVAWDMDELKDRILYRQSIETIRCLEEKVLETAHDANIGSIFGIGFPAWTGGALQFTIKTSGSGVTQVTLKADYMFDFTEAVAQAQVKSFGTQTQYDNVSHKGHHDHLICTGCVKIVEFENCDIERLQEEVAARNGVTIKTHRLELYGLCSRCGH